MDVRADKNDSDSPNGCWSLAEFLRKTVGPRQLLGRSKGIQQLRQRIARISQYDIDVLISGESGTGKELAARAIHYSSLRAGKPFVPVNCGALPETVFENEMFGHVKGAYTDAGRPQTGLVREAEGGTLFLDEIGVLSLRNQVKLLRLLQNREYKCLGDSTPRKADIRIVAATNKDLRSLVNQGGFRDDLYLYCPTSSSLLKSWWRQ